MQTERVTKYVQSLDPSRLYNPASGWVDANVGDLIDMHKYVGPGALYPTSTRASVLGEFGGLGLKVDQHQWIPEDSFSYEMQVCHDAVVLLTVGIVVSPCINNLTALTCYIESLQTDASQGVTIAAFHAWVHAPVAKQCNRPCARINLANIEIRCAPLSSVCASALHNKHAGTLQLMQCSTVRLHDANLW